MPVRMTLLILNLAGLLLLASNAVAVETPIDVRVISKGAKFIGSSMGGVQITIYAADTGQLLAKGSTTGTTGDTAAIMRDPAPHHAPVSTSDAAVFSTSLDLAAPTPIRIVAYGPLAQPQAAQTVSLTQWVLPGKGLTGGDGILLEMPGLVVDILEPPAHLRVGDGDSIELNANIAMMCGCPLTPGGLWDAADFEIAAIVMRDGQQVAEVPLSYAGTPSQFRATIPIGGSGVHQITVYAYQPANGNTGLDRTTVLR